MSTTTPRTATAATLLAASTLTVMAPTIVAPALPSIARTFSDAPSAEVLVPLVLTLPALVIAVTASLVGVMVDRRGRRPVLVGGIVLYGLAGGTGLVVGSLPALLAGRVGLGLAVAMVLTAVTTVIGDLYTGVERSRMLSRQAAAMGVSGTVFTVTSGVLAAVSWRWSFLLYPLAWLLLPAVLRAIPGPSRRQQSRQAGVEVGGDGEGDGEGDGGGDGGGDGEGDGEVPDDGTSPVTGPGTVTSFGSPPESPPPIARAALVVVVVSILLLMGVQVLFYLLPVQLPFVLEEVFGLGPARTGLLVAMPPLAYAGASLLATRFATDRRRASVVAGACAVTSIGYLAIGTATALWAVAVGLVIGGAGLGLIVPNLVAWVAQAAPVHLRGRLVGLMTSALFLGQFVSPLVWNPVVTALGRQHALVVAAATLLAATPLALATDAVRRVRGPRTTPDTT